MSDGIRDDVDELSRRTRALAEARATVDRLAAENEALRRKTGGGRPVAALPPACSDRADAAAYRSEDRLVRLERDIDAANSAIANLSIENAILQSRATPKQNGKSPAGKVLAGVAIAGGGAGIWFATENVGLLLLAAALLSLGWGIYAAIGAITPDGSNRTRPPLWPGGSGS
ncbi:MAG: hypothetical protein QM820_57350 [Minicystis sp.]